MHTRESMPGLKPDDMYANDEEVLRHLFFCNTKDPKAYVPLDNGFFLSKKTAIIRDYFCSPEFLNSSIKNKRS